MVQIGCKCSTNKETSNYYMTVIENILEKTSLQSYENREGQYKNSSCL